jgi:flagellar motor switch protein FliG
MKYPFKEVFKLSPQYLAHVLRHEANQTKVFILSFARNQGYIKKVLEIFNDKELNTLASGYLSKVENESLDLCFTKNVETYLEKIIGSELSHIKLRKNKAIANIPK